MHNPSISFKVYNTTFEGTARIIDQKGESSLAVKVSDLMSKKYNWGQGLIVELTQKNA